MDPQDSRTVVLVTEPLPEGSPVGDVFAHQLRRYRQARRWSVRRLAEECASIGAVSLTEPSIVNLERKTGRRRVTVEDWIGLAAALRVPPLALIAPVGAAGTVEIRPGVTWSTYDALEWLTGAYERSETDDEWPWPLGTFERASVDLHRRAGQYARHAEDDLCRGELEENDKVLRWLVRTREAIEGRGEVPPLLPVRLAEFLASHPVKPEDDV